MNPRSLLMLLARVSPLQMFVIIVGLAAGVTWLIAAELERQKPAPVLANLQPVKQKAQVLFTSRNLEEGATISADDVAVRLVELDRAPIDAVGDTESVVGRTIKFPVAAGTILSLRDLAPMGSLGTGFQAKLRPGERAITMAVDSTTGVAGFISPDSHVDVMVQVGNGSETKTQAILSDARVVASGTIYQKVAGQDGAVPASTVTVAVEPKDAGKLINAMGAGRIFLTLRSDRDHTPIAVSDLSTLFKKPVTQPVVIANIPPPVLPPPEFKVEAPPVPQNPMHEIELYAGNHRDVISTQK